MGIDKFCGIFKTQSDMRLGTNLYQGLKMMIDKKIDAGEFPTSLQNLKDTFEKMNRLKDGFPTPTWH